MLIHFLDFLPVLLSNNAGLFTVSFKLAILALIA